MIFTFFWDYEWIGNYYQRYPKNGEASKWNDLGQRILRVIRGGSSKLGAEVDGTYIGRPECCTTVRARMWAFVATQIKSRPTIP